jgi:hypothetical protein
MYQFYTDAADSFVGNRDLEMIRKINPRLRSLEDWIICSVAAWRYAWGSCESVAQRAL